MPNKMVLSNGIWTLLLQRIKATMILGSGVITSVSTKQKINTLSATEVNWQYYFQGAMCELNVFGQTRYNRKHNVLLLIT